ncbi:MAG: putative quinol monooxygenase [Pseudomonadota bacterium]
MTDRLFLMARIEPKSEHLADAKQAIHGIINETRAEKGCFRFELHEGVGDGCLYLYEEWSDKAALAAHYAQPYTKDVFAKYQNWLAREPDIFHMRHLA